MCGNDMEPVLATCKVIKHFLNYKYQTIYNTKFKVWLKHAKSPVSFENVPSIDRKVKILNKDH